MAYKEIEHTADIQFKIRSIGLKGIFKEAMKITKKSIYSKKVQKKVQKKVEVHGKDLENLLYNFLEELLILLDSENFIFSKMEKINLNLKEKKLHATILGDASEKYNLDSEIKAITYNEMYVKKKMFFWEAVITFDV